MTKITMWKKVKKKKKITITSKPHAHPHTMKKMQVKFHNNLYKTEELRSQEVPTVYI